MAGVLSRAAGRLATSARPAKLMLTTIRRPTFGSHPNSPLPRFVHSQTVVPAAGLPEWFQPEWFREQIKVLVKEAVEAELKEMKATSMERFETLATKITALSEVSATRYAECMLMFIDTQQQSGKVAFRVCAGMISVAAAAQYKDEIKKILLSILGGGPGEPPSKEEINKAVDDKMEEATNEIKTEVKHQIAVALAKSFLEQQEKKDNGKPE